MIDKFGNAFYLIIYLAHFIIVGSYAYQLVFDTKKFLKGRGVDKTATLITRFAGSFMIAIDGGKIMRRILSIFVLTLTLSLFTLSVFAAGDAENVKKLSEKKYSKINT